MRPISAVVIRIVKKNNDSTTIAFSSTQKDGKFYFNIKTKLDSSLIIAQHLGYYKKIKYIYFLNKNPIKCNFILEEKETYLKEVIVRKIIPIKISSDTTVFKVTKFIDGSEKNVEDVLKKIPGLEVKVNGDITYKGKKIEKITIEGEDFFSNNYKLISKNMPSFTLDKVEAIENYNENPLLKGISKSDKTILNLGLKDDLKKTTFGNAQLGAGIAKRYEINNTLFSLLSKIKIGQIINANNVGLDVIGETEFSLQTKNTIETTDFEVNPNQLKVNESMTNPGISPSRYISNNSKLLAINVNKKIHKTVKLKLWSYGFYDKTNQQANNALNYSFLDSSIQITDTYNLTKSPKFIKNYLEIEYNSQKNTSLKVQSLGTLSKPISIFFNKNKYFGIEQIATSNYNETNFSTSNYIEFTKKINDKRAFLTYLTYKNNYNDNCYTVFSKMFSIVNDSKLVDGINQNIKLKENEFATKIKYIERKNNLFINTSIDFKYSNNNLLSKLNLLSSNDQLLELLDPYKSIANYQKKSLSIDLGIVWDIKKWSIISASSYHIGNIYFTDSIIGSKRKFDFMNQLIGVRLVPKDGQKLQITQSLMNTVSNLLDINQGYSLTNYRTFQRGTNVFNQSNSSTTMISYSFTDITKQLSFFNNFSFVKTDSPYIVNTLINKNIFFNTILPTDKVNYFFNFNSQIDKYIHFLRSRIRTSVLWSKSSNFFEREGELGENNQNSLALNALLSTGFNFPLNIEIGTSNNRTIVISLENSFNNRKFITKSLFSTIRFKYKNIVIGN